MQDLQDFVSDLNIARFSMMAAEEQCPEKRAVLEELLAEARARIPGAHVQEP
jgi:hypothetical protein